MQISGEKSPAAHHVPQTSHQSFSSQDPLMPCACTLPVAGMFSLRHVLQLLHHCPGGCSNSPERHPHHLQMKLVINHVPLCKTCRKARDQLLHHVMQNSINIQYSGFAITISVFHLHEILPCDCEGNTRTKKIALCKRGYSLC